MSSKEINEIKNLLAKQNVIYNENDLYTTGKNPKIFSKPKTKKPDERIPSPWATMTVDNYCGYQAKPGNITIKLVKKGDRGDDEGVMTLNNIWRQLEDFNNDILEIPELYRESISQGYAYEIWWTTTEADVQGLVIAPEWKIVSGAAGYPVWSNDLKPKLEAFYYFTEEYDTNTEKIIETVTIYKPFLNEIWSKPEDLDTWVQVELVETPYSQVSVASFFPNRKKTPIFEAGKLLINSYDELISKSMNEVLRFNDLFLML